MNFKKVLELVVGEFQKSKVDFALIGALALHFSGVTRDTVDVDFVVLLSQSDQVDEIMQKCGYKAGQRNQNVANYFPLYPGLPQIDFLFAHRKYALEMLKRAEKKEVFGAKVKVLQPEDLIGLKVQSSSNDPNRRHKDMADIEELIQKNKTRLNFGIVREYFKLFDREKELDEILGRLG